MEAELGIVFFDRSAYRATLTDAGRLFFERAANLVAEAEALHGFAAALTEGGELVVRLVIEAITPLGPVLTALHEVQSLFPAVRYELRTERLNGALETLRDSEADLVIAGGKTVDRRTTVAQRFRDVRIVPVVRRDHVLAHAGSPVPSALLRQHPQVVLRDSARGELTQTVNVLEGGVRWTVTDVPAKLQIIQAGMGWGGLPEHVVAGGIADGTLVRLDVREFEVELIELFAMRRRDRPHGPVAQALWTRLRA